MANVILRINRDLLNIQDRVAVALESAGLVAEGYAKLRCPVDTGRLRGSITHSVIGNKAIIGTNVEYAAYIEFGTGARNVSGGTAEASWVYRDALGRFHRAFPQRPRPYLKPAISEHVDEYMNILKAVLSGK